MAKKLTPLAELARSLKPPRNRQWIDAVPAADREELLDLRQRFQAGEYQVKASVIYRELIKERYGEHVADSTFVRWMGRDR